MYLLDELGRLCKHSITGSTHVFLQKYQSHTEAVKKKTKKNKKRTDTKHSAHNSNEPVASLSNAIRAQQTKHLNEKMECFSSVKR